MPAGIQTEKRYAWVSGDFDWLGGEEQLQVTYVIPQESSSDVHLFGDLNYYGQDVQLIYKNELMDRQAWPRHLGAERDAWSPDDADSAIPLLPPRSE